MSQEQIEQLSLDAEELMSYDDPYEVYKFILYLCNKYNLTIPLQVNKKLGYE